MLTFAKKMLLINSNGPLICARDLIDPNLFDLIQYYGKILFLLQKKGSYYRYTIELHFFQKNLTFLLHIYSELEILGYIKYLAHISGPLE